MVIYLRSLVRLCFGAGGTLQTNITGVCQECLQCMDHTGFAQSHGMCFLVLHCLGCRVLCGALSKAGPGVSCTSQVRATWVQVLRYSTRAQTLLGMRFVPFPGLLTLCNPMDCSPGSSVFHYLPELAQTHVHLISDAIQPSHPLSSPSPPAFNLTQHPGFFQ